MKQVITFKSNPDYYEKEKLGLKCNTVRNICYFLDTQR